MSTKNSFCWLRVLDSTVDAAEPAERARSLVGRCGVSSRDGRRPPGSVASWAKVPASAGHAVGALEIGTVAWTLQAGKPESGGASLVFDHGPAFDDEADASAWMNEPQGQAWAAEARAYVLIAIHLCATHLPALDESLDVPDLDNQAQTPQPYVFDSKAWEKTYLYNHLPRRNPALLLLRLEALVPTKTQPPGCAPPEHQKTGAECDALLALQRARTDTQRRRITHESQSTHHAIEPVLAASALGSQALDSPVARELISWVADSVDPVVYGHKRYFMRARPVHLRPGQLQPLFPPGSRHHPGHPSYPSGHATMAHVWAQLLGRCKGGDTKALSDAADAIAKNREIAGVHFESDSTAGKALAKLIVDHMLDPARNPNHADFVAKLMALGLKP